MNRPARLLLGAATIAPLALFGFQLLRALGLAFDILHDGGSVHPASMFETMRGFVATQVATIALLVGLLCFYLWHVLVRRAHREPRDQVLIWVLALVFVPIVAMPIYWFTQIWPEGDARTARGAGIATARR